MAQNGYSPKQQIALRSAVGPAKQRLQKLFDSQKQQSASRGTRASRRARVPRPISAPQGMSRAAPHANHAGLSGADLRRLAWGVTPASMNMIAPRGLGYYDAFSNHTNSSMTHLSIGPATAIEAITTVTGVNTAFGLPVPSSSGTQPAIAKPWNPKHAQLIIINPAPDRRQVARYWVGWDTTTNTFQGVMSGAFYQSSALPTGTNSDPLPADRPELKEMIPTRCSVRIRNSSANFSVGGSVRVLRMTTGCALVATQTTAQDFWTLCEGIREHGRTVRYDGKSFCEGGLQKNCTVCDQSKALSFQDYNMTFESDPAVFPIFPPSTTTTPYTLYSFQFSLADPAMTPIAILIEPFASQTYQDSGPYFSGNTYDMTVKSHFLAHYYQGTMLANMALNPRADANLMNRHRDKEEAHGSAMHRVMGDIIHGAKEVAKHVPWGELGSLARTLL